MLLVPTEAIANQTLQVSLGGQPTTLNIYQLAYGLFMDVLVNGAVIVQGVICQDRSKIVRDQYRGFTGDLGWVDTQGTSDPVYTGLGDRWQLWYLEAADLGG